MSKVYKICKCGKILNHRGRCKGAITLHKVRFCEICGARYKNLSSHYQHKHNMTSKEYYDKFMKKEGEGICSKTGCLNETTFCNLELGYRRFCSLKCSNSDVGVQQKKTQSYLRSLGVEHPLQNQEIKDKFHKTCLERYGFKYPSQSEEIKGKMKLTMLLRFGVENASQSVAVKEKKKRTCLNNFGVIHYFKTEKYRTENVDRMKKGQAAYMASFVRNPSVPQVELLGLVKSIFKDAVLNHSCLNYSIDVAIPSLMVAIEYDEPYWHQNLDHDLKRQQEIEQQGWKFIRYKRHVPSKEELTKDLGGLLHE